MRWLLRPSHLAIFALGLVLLYTLVGYLLVPYLIKAYAIPAVAEKLKRPVSVKELDLPTFEEERAQVASKPPTIEDMRRQLAAAIPVPDSDLHLLAQQRAEEMRGQLAGDGKLADERVFLTEVDLTASDHEKVKSRLSITAGQ
jgi:hypothetical protein